MTVCVDRDNNQFIKFTHGFEKMAKGDSDVEIRRTEREIYEACEKIIDARVKKLHRLIRRLNRELGR